MQRHAQAAGARAAGGFTTVELVIVIAIIMITTSYGLYYLKFGRQTVLEEKAKADLEQIAQALRELAWDTGRWPGKLLRTWTLLDDETWDLSTASAGLVRNDSSSPFPNWKGPYLASIPKDPWGQDYFFDPDYRIGPKPNCIVVGSFGPNKEGRNLYDSDDIYVQLNP